VRRRQQTAARQDDDRSALATAFERQRHVDHGQARADDEDRRVGRETFERAGAPRLFGRKAVERRLGVVAGGEDRDVRRQRFTGREREPHVVGLFFDVETKRTYAPDASIGQRLSGEVGEVVAIEAARDEREPIRRARAAARAEPRDEVVRLAGECAHIGDAHIEEVPGIVGGVRQPAAKRLARLDHHDFVVRRVEPPREMRRHEDPRRAAADDRDSHGLLHTLYHYCRLYQGSHCQGDGACSRIHRLPMGLQGAAMSSAASASGITRSCCERPRRATVQRQPTPRGGDGFR